MRTSITRIAIPQPCNQDWDNMHIVNDGRFCHSCQKTVTDFSKLSNNEIIARLTSSPNICGRFNDEQLISLNQQLQEEQLPTISKSVFIKIAATVIAALSFINVRAQVKAKPTNRQHKTVQHTRPDFEPLINLPVKSDKIVGKVTDSKGKPLPGVRVKFLNDEVSVLTDSNGDYGINSSKSLVGSTISFSAVGYMPQDISLNTLITTYNVALQEQATECATTSISGTVGGLIVYRVPLVKRVWRTITWPFRAIF